MIFGWTYPHKDRIKSEDSKSVLSPTMPGGLYTINTDFWRETGEYDLNMQGWGGENFEISLRTWLCRGSIEMHPCSHVGHIFRAKSPYSLKTILFEKNLLRAAVVWMDDYAVVARKYYKTRYSKSTG